MAVHAARYPRGHWYAPSQVGGKAERDAPVAGDDDMPRGASDASRRKRHRSQ